MPAVFCGIPRPASLKRSFLLFKRETNSSTIEIYRSSNNVYQSSKHDAGQRYALYYCSDMESYELLIAIMFVLVLLCHRKQMRFCPGGVFAPGCRISIEDRSVPDRHHRDGSQPCNPLCLGSRSTRTVCADSKCRSYWSPSMVFGSSRQHLTPVCHD